MKRRRTRRGFALSFVMILFPLLTSTKNNIEWRNWVTCDILGSSIKLGVVEGKPLYVQCIGIEQDIARHSYGNSSFESLPSKHRRKGCISRQLCYSLAGVEADQDTLKVSFQSCHSGPSPCDTLATRRKWITTFWLPHLFHFSSTGSTHGRLFQCQRVGVKFRTFEDKDTYPHSKTFRDTWHTIGPEKFVEWIKVWKVILPLICGSLLSP